MPTAHLWPVSVEGVWSARLEFGAWSHDLFYDRMNEPLDALTRVDALLVGSLMTFMWRGATALTVHGPVSRKLLRNLDELQHVWSKWRPTIYKRVDLDVERVLDDSPSGDGAISAYSGGIDASFTVYRHTAAPQAWHTFPIHEVVLVEHVDTESDESGLVRQQVEVMDALLGSTGVSISRVRTNMRRLAWRDGDTSSIGLASVLHLFADRRAVGLIGSSADYANFVYPTSSTPIADRLTSSGSMEIRQDGAGFSRTEKVAFLKQWPAVLDNVRVCGRLGEGNCGRCEKCTRTKLNYKLAGYPESRAFDRSFRLTDMRRVYFTSKPVAAEWDELVSDVRRWNCSRSYATVLSCLLVLVRYKEHVKAAALGRFIKRLKKSR